MIWMLLLAVYPPELTLSAIPGSTVEIPLTIISEGPVRVIGSGVLEADTRLSVNGKTRARIPARIPADANTSTGYLYVVPDGEGAVLSGVGVTVHASLEHPASTSIHRSVPGKILALVATMVAGVILVAGALYLKNRRAFIQS